MSSGWFNSTEPPRTHVKPHYRSGYLPFAMVLAGSDVLNHPELMSSSTTGLVPYPVLWCEQVRGGSVGLNHPELMSTSTTGVVTPMPRFEEVGSGSVELNHPELMSSSTTGLVPYPVLWF